MSSVASRKRGAAGHPNALRRVNSYAPRTHRRTRRAGDDVDARRLRRDQERRQLVQQLVVVLVGQRQGRSERSAQEGHKTVSIPKQLGNPYEEFEHSGVDEALKELGGSNTISGPTDAGASTQ